MVENEHKHYQRQTVTFNLKMSNIVRLISFEDKLVDRLCKLKKKVPLIPYAVQTYIIVFAT